MFAHPFRGFDRTDAGFASIWFVFLVPVLLGHGPPAARIAFVGLYIVVYFFASGANTYYPRGISQGSREWLHLGVQLAIVAFSVPWLGLSASGFVPFLSAFVSFDWGSRWAPAVVAAIALGSAGVAIAVDKTLWVSFLAMCVLTPALIFAMSRFVAHSKRETQLTHDLDLSTQRESIARDVHDVLGHSLTVITLKAEVARRLVDQDPKRAKEELEQIAALSRTSLAQTRSTVTRIQNPDLKGEIEAARRGFSTAGIDASLPEDPAVAGSNATLFSWALRETTTNILRHSRATEAVVELGPSYLRITDNGIGCDPAHLPAGGLTGLRQRVEAAGGTMTIDGSHGTTVTVNMAGGA